MNTINERIRYVRKNILKISQQELSKKIGISQNAVSWSEKPNNNVSDITIKAICTIFNVNEEWLRYGTEPIFIESDTFDLNKFIEQQGATDLEKEIVRTYFELPQEIRRPLLEHFMKKFGYRQDVMTVNEMQEIYNSAPDEDPRSENNNKKII